MKVEIFFDLDEELRVGGVKVKGDWGPKDLWVQVLEAAIFELEQEVAPKVSVESLLASQTQVIGAKPKKTKK